MMRLVIFKNPNHWSLNDNASLYLSMVISLSPSPSLSSCLCVVSEERGRKWLCVCVVVGQRICLSQQNWQITGHRRRRRAHSHQKGGPPFTYWPISRWRAYYHWRGNPWRMVMMMMLMVVVQVKTWADKCCPLQIANWQFAIYPDQWEKNRTEQNGAEGRKEERKLFVCVRVSVRKTFYGHYCAAFWAIFELRATCLCARQRAPSSSKPYGQTMLLKRLAFSLGRNAHIYLCIKTFPLICRRSQLFVGTQLNK